jgi:hypothetical protein
MTNTSHPTLAERAARRRAAVLRLTTGICRHCGTAITLAADGAWDDESGACGCGSGEHEPTSGSQTMRTSPDDMKAILAAASRCLRATAESGPHAARDGSLRLAHEAERLHTLVAHGARSLEV